MTGNVAVNPMARCQQLIAQKIRPNSGQRPHVTIYDEDIEGDPDGAVNRCAEAFTSTNASSNCPLEERQNRVVAKVRYVPGTQVMHHYGYPHDAQNAATGVAFEHLLDKLSTGAP